MSSQKIRGILAILFICLMAGATALRHSVEVDAFDPPASPGPVFTTAPFVPDLAAQSARFADVDGDLDLDLVTGILTRVSVRLNDGNGNYGAYSILGVDGTEYHNLDLRDLNGDTFLDIVSIDQNAQVVSVFLGNGDGTFDAPLATFASGISGQVHIAFADFDEDTNMDLLLSGHANEAAHNPPVMFPGIGDGTFGAGVTLDFSPLTTTVINNAEVGDFNGDGNVDVAATAANDDSVGVLLGNGDGTFDPAATFAVGDRPVALAVGNLNGGGQDLVVGSAGIFNTLGLVNVLLGNGDGTFAAASTNVIPSGGISDIAIYDAGNDATMDVVGLGSFLIDQVFVMEGAGDGSLTFVGANQLILEPQYLDVGDADGDGQPDVAVAAGTDGTAGYTEGVFLLPGNGPTFTAVQSYMFGHASGASVSPQAVIHADMDNDGDEDLLVAQFSSHAIGVSLNDGDGTFGASVEFSVGAASPLSIATGDFDEDGFRDVVWQGGDTGGSSSGIIFNDGAGGLAGPVSITGTGAGDIVVGDFNEDGNLDFARDHFVDIFTPSANKIRVYAGDGAGGFSFTTLDSNDSSRGLLIGDYNEDGNQDLAISRQSNGNVGVFLGNGDGTFGAMTTFAVGSNISGIAQADFNGDGNVDIAAATSNDLNFLAGNGDGTFDAVITFAAPLGSGGNVKYLAAGDIDLDTDQDLVLSTSQAAARVYLGNGDLTFDAPQEYDFSDGAFRTTLGQFDGLNGLDLAASDGLSNAWVMLQNGGTSDPGATLSGAVQSGYRFYEEIVDSTNVGTPLAATDTPAVLATPQQSFRMRLLLRADGQELIEDDPGSFALQISERGVDNLCDAAGVGETYAALQNESGVIQYDNSTSADDNTLFTPNTNDPDHAGVTVFRETYNDAGIFDFGGGAFFSSLISRIEMAFGLDGNIEGDAQFDLLEDTHIAQDAEGLWDFLLKDVSAPASTTYCIKVVDDSGADILGYEEIAEITTAAGTPAPTGRLFTTPTFIPEGGASMSRFGDVDGDADIDLVTIVRSLDAETTLSSITVRLNDGTGVFGQYTDVADEIDGRHIALADFTGDGDLDILATGPNTGTPLVNNGDGTFTVQNTVAISAPNATADFGDFNEDSNADFVFGNNIFLGNGDGTFGDAVSVDFSTSVQTAVVADFNEDGFDDLVGTVGANAPGVVLVLGDGTGAFGTADTYDTFIQTFTSLTVDDLDGDGNLDVIIGSGENDDENAAVSVLPGDGTGLLGAEEIFPIPLDGIADLVTTDIDGDIDQDVIGLSHISPVVFFMENDGAGNLTYSRAFVSENAPFHLSVGDIESDGDPDLALSISNGGNANNPENTGTYIYRRVFDSVNFDAPSAFVVSANGNTIVDSIATADMDNDGNLDLLATDRVGQAIVVSFGNGNGTFEPATAFSTGASIPGDLVIGDFDGVNGPDVAWGAQDTFFGTSHSGRFLNNGAGGLVSQAEIANVNADVIASADFNEDGFIDLVLAEPAFPGETTLHVLFGDGTGDFPTDSVLATNGLAPAMVVNDFNEDGFDDIAFLNPDDGFSGLGDDVVGIYIGNGDGTFDALVENPVPAFEISLVAGDVDGNGDIDLASVEAFDDNVTTLMMLPGNGDGTFAAAITTDLEDPAGVIPQRIVLGDVDADGFVDLVMTDVQTARDRVYAGNGDFTFDTPETYRFGQDGRNMDVLLADFDGENGLDLAVSTLSNLVFVLRQSGAASDVGQTFSEVAQSGYRIYQNADSSAVSASLAAQDTPATLPSDGAAFRVRMLMRADQTELEFNENAPYKLQFAEQGIDGLCDAGFSGETYADLLNTGTDIIYADNAVVADSTNEAGRQGLSPFAPNSADPRHGATDVFRQGYNDAAGGVIFGEGTFFDPSAVGDELFNLRESTIIPEDAEGLWDFALQDNVLDDGNVTYCVRAVQSDNTPLNGYESIAEFTTSDVPAPVEPAPFIQSGYRWYENEDSVAPGAPLADINTPATLTEDNQNFRLRFLAHSTNGPEAGENTFSIAVAEKSGTCDAAGVGETYQTVPGGGFIYSNNNPDTFNGSSISALPADPTHGADTVVPQSYHDGDDGTNSFGATSAIQDEEDGMWDLALQEDGATEGASYCFRVEVAGFSVLEDYEQIAELTTFEEPPPPGGGGGGNNCPFVSGTMTINDGGSETADRNITLRFETTNATRLTVSESPTLEGASPIPFATEVPFTLSEGLGQKTVYYFLGNGCAQTPIFSRNITVIQSPLISPPEDLSPGDGDPAAAHIREGDPGSRTNPRNVLVAGTYVRTVSDTTVYYIDTDLHRHAVLDARSFFTHEESFGVVEYVTDEIIVTAQTDDVVVPEFGTILITFWDGPDVFAIFQNPANGYRPILRKIDTEDLAAAIFGPNWRANVVDFNPAFHVLFEDGPPIISPESVRTTDLQTRTELSQKAGLIKIETEKRNESRTSWLTSIFMQLFGKIPR